jgi:hypothetical protein
MMKLLTLSAALLLTVSASQNALAQGHGGDKPGKGKDHGDKHANKDHPGKGGGKDHKDKDRGDKGHGNWDRGDKDHGAKGHGEWDRGDRNERFDQQAGRGDKHERDRVFVAGADGDRRHDRNDRQVVVLTPYRDDGLIRGCPPGLAKKHNGCLPPGQAKKMRRALYDFRWGDPYDGFVHRYDGGYQYRYDRQGSLLGYLPALGGVLSTGNLWPTQYGYRPLAPYQVNYYGLNDPYDYRYADGAIYGVDPKTSMIQQVAALLTGQSPAVGQRMPSGYDIYNVPYAYRNQYVDTASAAYRYNDGAIYQLDPKTQMIMAVIQLLA